MILSQKSDIYSTTSESGNFERINLYFFSSYMNQEHQQFINGIPATKNEYFRCDYQTTNHTTTIFHNYIIIVFH